MPIKLTAKGSIRIEGLDKLLRKLRSGDPIYAEPWKRALLRAVQLGKATAIERAPRLTGRMAGNITSRIDPKPVPFWGIVKNTADNSGFRYPFALNAGKGRGGSVTHYRSTSRQGRSTKGWFSGTLRAIRPAVNALLNSAAREIEARWQR